MNVVCFTIDVWSRSIGKSHPERKIVPCVPRRTRPPRAQHRPNPSFLRASVKSASTSHRPDPFHSAYTFLLMICCHVEWADPNNNTYVPTLYHHHWKICGHVEWTDLIELHTTYLQNLIQFIHELTSNYAWGYFYYGLAKCCGSQVARVQFPVGTIISK